MVVLGIVPSWDTLAQGSSVPGHPAPLALQDELRPVPAEPAGGGAAHKAPVAPGASPSRAPSRSPGGPRTLSPGPSDPIPRAAVRAKTLVLMKCSCKPVCTPCAMPSRLLRAARSQPGKLCGGEAGSKGPGEGGAAGRGTRSAEARRPRSSAHA